MRAIFLLAALILGTPAHAVDLKGIRPGMKLAEVRQLYPKLRCSEKTENDLAGCIYSRPTYDPNGERTIAELDTVAGSRTDVWALEFTPQDEVSRIVIAGRPSAFGEISIALAEKFGKPTRTRTQVFQNAFGAKFQGHENTWLAGPDFIVLREYDGSRETLGLIVGRTKLMDQADAFTRGRAKAKAKDL